MSRYIDADRLLEVLNGFTKFHHIETLTVGTFVDMIADIPTAEVREVVRGEWVEDIQEPFASTYHCSNCGQSPLCEEDWVLSNYCPNCGARMGDGE